MNILYLEDDFITAEQSKDIINFYNNHSIHSLSLSLLYLLTIFIIINPTRQGRTQVLGPYQGLQFPVTLSHNVILCHTFTPLLPFPFRNQVVVCVSVLMYWQWSLGLAPSRSSLHRQATDSAQPSVRPVTPKQLCSPLYHYTIYIGLVNYIL